MSVPHRDRMGRPVGEGHGDAPRITHVGARQHGGARAVPPAWRGDMHGIVSGACCLGGDMHRIVSGNCLPPGWVASQ